jgi:hypothetical protein
MGFGSGAGLKHILGGVNLKRSVVLASVYMNVAALPGCWVAKGRCFAWLLPCERLLLWRVYVHDDCLA